MGVNDTRWHMVSCVDDRCGEWVGVVDMKRKKGRKVASLPVLFLVKGCFFASVIFGCVFASVISILQSFSGRNLRGWESMFKLLFRDIKRSIYAMVLMLYWKYCLTEVACYSVVVHIVCHLVFWVFSEFFSIERSMSLCMKVKFE